MYNRCLKTALAALLLSVTVACGEITFQNNNGLEAGFDVGFRNGNAFPHVSSADDILLLEVSDTDTGDPVIVHVYIDGDKVRTLTNAGLLNEVPFPPATWIPTPGNHTLQVEAHGFTRTLAFTFQ